MPVNGKKIVTWIEKELPPLSWGVVSIKAMKFLLAEGVSARAITEETVFSDSLVAEIAKIIKDTYKKDLPAL